jgi:hypothetical protein
MCGHLGKLENGVRPYLLLPEFVFDFGKEGGKEVDEV